MHRQLPATVFLAAGPRPGSASTWLLFSCGVLLAAFALAVNSTRLWQIRIELQIAGDAAALAAAATLVDDDLLRGDPTLMPALLQRSAVEAQRFAQFNLVQGQPFSLTINLSNPADGDLTFGTLDAPQSRQLILAEDLLNPVNSSLLSINTVHVTPSLTSKRGTAPSLVFGQAVSRGTLDVRTESAAMLDRDVVGFRPIGQQTLPLAPLAIFSDPSAADARSWQNQVEAKHGRDQFRYDRVAKTFVADPAGDGLFEFQAVLPLDASQQASANVSLIYLGVADNTGLSQQLAAGVTAAQLQAFGGQLVLQPNNNQLSVPGSSVGPAFGTSDATLLYQTLVQLQAQATPRLWPLFCGTDGAGQPILCGFVAARVVTVAPLVANQPLTFVLQPTMVSSPFAVTNAAQRGVGGIAITNPYICKVRVVQ